MQLLAKGVLFSFLLLLALPAAAQTDICIPQFVDGMSDGLLWRTTLIVRNQEQTQSQLQIHIRQADGDGMQLRMRQRRGEQAQQHNIEDGSFSPDAIRERATVAYRSEGDGPLQTGYALVQSQTRIQARAQLQLHDGNGHLLSEVSLVPAAQFQSGTLHVDHTENGQVGLAFVNASDTTTATVTLELFSPDGVSLGTTTFDLGPRAHIARFVSEWLSGLLTDDVGYLAISSSSPVCGVGVIFREMTMTQAQLFVDE